MGRHNAHRHQWPRGATTAAIAVAIVVAGLGGSDPAFALEGEHNRLPEICQGVLGAAYSASEAGSWAAPPPADFGFAASAYSNNLGLKYCPPQILAPEDVSFMPDSTSRGSGDPDSDPACYATVRPRIVQEEYDNILGGSLPLSDWGPLGTPRLYHFNTSADVRIIQRERPVDDPATDGDESLDDAIRFDGRDANGPYLRLPVGRNSLGYRADTLISWLDVVLIPLPKPPPGSRAQKEAVKRSPKLAERVLRGARGTIKTARRKHNLDERYGIDFRHGQYDVPLLNGPDIYNEDFQDVWVYDRIPPDIRASTNIAALPERTRAVVSYDATRNVYVIEAIHPGGIKGPDAIRFLGQLIETSDHCDRAVIVRNDGGGAAFWPVNQARTVRWTASDPGPRDSSGRPNETVLEMNVEVRDSYPPVLLAPPSIVREVPAGQNTLELDLGHPRVFDLVQLRPTIANDASGTTFNRGLTQITWSASDGTNSDTAVQLVNIKEEGTNVAPTAAAQSVEARSFEEKEIILRASDPDYHESVGRYDPLTFTITENPQNGFFVAPLLPYFIDDVRLEAGADRFENQPWQAQPAAYCRQRAGNHDEQNPRMWEAGYPYQASWIAVDDAGNSIVYDRGSLACTGGSTGDLDVNSRLVVFNEHHDVIATTSGFDGRRVEDIFWEHSTGRIFVTVSDTQGSDYIHIYDRSLTLLRRYNMSWQNPVSRLVSDPTFAQPDHQGILYVGQSGYIKAYRLLEDGTEVAASNSYLGDVFDPGSRSIVSISIDSQNNLYVNTGYQIHKLSAASLSPEGVFTPGEYIGWSGRCTANLTNEYACDIPNQRSLGYACTDALCQPGQAGSLPGQFDEAGGIVVDPHDILYVSDPGNDRVQRFTPDGFFAGEARSQGQGFGFLLGDFGTPRDIEVNSNHFYVLNDEVDLLHIFETTPVTPLDDTSARVVYRSNNNFIGSDSFRFSVTDGFAGSQAQVSVNVTRNFRAPSIPNVQAPLTVPAVNEDSVATFVLDGSDPDGTLDTLSVVVVEPPQHGTVTFSGLTATYTPAPNYYGTDSFVYQVSDGNAVSAERQTVDLTIEAVEDAPAAEAAESASASVGFLLAHDVEVFDPDAGEQLMVSIDWGDGATTVEGHFTLQGQPISWDEALNEDGTPRDGLEATGPILGLQPDGRGLLTADHAYASAGTYDITSCVYDRVQIDATTQVKSPTGASRQACATTRVTVSDAAELAVEVEAPQDDLAPGDAVPFVITVRNRAFDLDPADPRHPLLPSRGSDAVGLVISGDAPGWLTVAAARPSQGACTTTASAITCTIPSLPYGSEMLIEVDARVATAAPGRATPALGLIAEWPQMRDSAAGAAFVTVASLAGMPSVRSLSPQGGDPDGDTEVTIEGENFELGAKVRFGSVYASEVEVVDRNTLRVRTPRQPAGTVDVTVANPEASEGVLSQSFTYETAVDPTPPVPPDPPNPTNPRDNGGGGGGAFLFEWLMLSALLVGWIRRRGHIRGNAS